MPCFTCSQGQLTRPGIDMQRRDKKTENNAKYITTTTEAIFTSK